MKRFWYFRDTATLADDDDNAQSIMVPVEDLVGFQQASDTTVDIYFKPQLSDTGGVPGAIINDKVQLTVKTAKRKEVMKALAEATNQGPHSDGITIIADDYATTYLTSDITAVASITVASQV